MLTLPTCAFTFVFVEVIGKGFRSAAAGGYQGQGEGCELEQGEPLL